jgi:hypothetical protein
VPNYRGPGRLFIPLGGWGVEPDLLEQRTIEPDHLAIWPYNQNKSILDFGVSTVSSIALENPVT